MAGPPSASRFHCQPLAELARQLHYAPKEKRHEQLTRAERLHDELDPAINYPFDYIAYRITRYRQTRGETVLLVGEAVRPDLRLIIDQLSRSLTVPIDAEPTATTSELSDRLGVSRRTIERWRKAGLRWRWVEPGDGGPLTVGYPEKAIEHFIAQHPDRVQKAGRFAHLSEAERQRLLERARRLASVTGASLNEVAAHLARRTGRGQETIRLLLARHDQAHPDTPLFAHHTGPLTPKQQRVIARAHRIGVPAGRIARRFRRSRSTIYRVINERRALEAQRLTLNHVNSRVFERDDADEVLLRPGMAQHALDASPGLSSTPVADLPEALQPVYRQPLVDEAHQRSLLLRYNYLKRKADRQRGAFDRYQPRAADLDSFDALIQEARAVRDLVVRVNLPTVLSLARRHLLDTPDPASQRLLALLRQGNAILFETIETYDPSRSQSFESYLSNTLMRRFASEETSTAGDTGKAQRRLSGEQMLELLRKDARQQHVTLPGNTLQPGADA